MTGFLDYVPGNSFLHRLNPLTKLLLSLILCVSCFISDLHLYVIAIIVLNLLLAASAGVFNRSIRMLKALLKFSVVLFVLQILFVRDGIVLLSLPLHLMITDKGLSFSLLFVLRLLAATMPLALMLSVTPMNDLSNVLVERLRIPYKYAFALMTAIRFIPIFSNEMAGIMEAQTARGVEFDTKNFFKKIRLLLPLCVPLLISSVKRIEGGAISVELRGFYCRKKGSGYKYYAFRSGDFISLGASVLLVTLAVIL
ncbi:MULTISPECIES: energy-coupling factor transporter transmembrane component T [unclassified Dehalobacter]|uniref:energy-coupling factor transporter transmembrane component T family protein n=1 Tax=unclassified Dehalobacter TaxID=2635733 RepID=UPI000E6CE481|nr:MULTISPECIES: energy-coupling factor transporter transmembrane component T [unclassified Dehalobacter]RJE47451.1 cobalt ABC transporter [Dehalobacter sp. MCB1]TCX48737.1 energy-coupling factor transporter transmembrane protein EcfT [Dehalobacter sp. 14DCB1]TCX56215.1 energy-coupling factor transporter transmembrane protein EcfT [Dehalobacter sp. 12DCB1]